MNRLCDGNFFEKTMQIPQSDPSTERLQKLLDDMRKSITTEISEQPATLESMKCKILEWLKAGRDDVDSVNNSCTRTFHVNVGEFTDYFQNLKDKLNPEYKKLFEEWRKESRIVINRNNSHYHVTITMKHDLTSESS